jgi:hypothetical protein
MERWWNLKVEIVVPFDSEQAAENAVRNLAWDRYSDLTEALFPNAGIVMSARLEERLDRGSRNVSPHSPSRAPRVSRSM